MWHPVEAEQEDAEKGRLQEECCKHFIAKERPEHVAGHDRKAAPVRADLVREHNSGDHSHGERNRKYLGPEPHEMLETVIAAAQPETAERRKIGGESDGEARKYDVKDNGEGEL